MRRFILPLLFLSLFACAKTDYIYRSPNRIDFVRLTKAKGEERQGLKHPYKLAPDKIREALRSVRFSKKALTMKEVTDEHLFEERPIEFLAPYLIEAFQKVTPEQVVVASYFTQRHQWGLTDDRLTIFRAFVKEDGLHLKFEKLYAKMLGDRTTKGMERTIQEARGMRVSLEVRPGQDRISWDPEEIVIRLDDRSRSVADPASPPSKKALSVRERLKELERLKKEELITQKEYREKRSELLGEL